MQVKTESYGFRPLFFVSLVLGFFVAAASLLIYFLLPNAKPEVETDLALIEEEPEIISEEELSASFKEYFAEASVDLLNEGSDKSLALYRNALSRSAVEWFYFQITGDRDVTQAILIEAEKNDIPLSLAFSLAHAESAYNSSAINSNSNSSIDRGLFQLNSNSFPSLTETDFFDPFVSAKYGMSHLRFCLNTAGNEVSGLAMYNAGTSRVRSNRTPQVTLNYVGKIVAYQNMLEELFDEQVADYYDTQLRPSIAIAYVKDFKQ